MIIVWPTWCGPLCWPVWEELGYKHLWADGSYPFVTAYYDGIKKSPQFQKGQDLYQNALVHGLQYGGGTDPVSQTSFDRLGAFGCWLLACTDPQMAA